MYGERAKAGDVYCLSGELGAGKTVFAKGFAAGLAVPDDVEIVSPTFVILNEYAGRLVLYHFDAYRCRAGDMREIGFEEYIYSGGVTLIEWPERVREVLPPGGVWIVILKDADDERVRHISARINV